MGKKNRGKKGGNTIKEEKQEEEEQDEVLSYAEAEAEEEGGKEADEPEEPLDDDIVRISEASSSSSLSSNKSTTNVPTVEFGNFPVELRISPYAGRYFVAKRDIQPSEIVLRCAPYVITVAEEFKRMVCSYCYEHYLNPLEYPCEGCRQVFYCDEECREKAQKEKYHNEVECLALKKLVKTNKFKDERSEIRIILNALALRATLTPQVRCKGTKKECVYPNYEELFQLHGHKSLYSQDMQEWLQEMADFTKSLFNEGELKGLPKNAVVDMFCKERMNSFGHWSASGKPLATAMYPANSFFNHACIPNCEAGYEKRDSIVKSLRFIPKGTELCISYIWVNPKATTAERRAKLKDSYLFTCVCRRCSDTTDAANQEVAAMVCRKKGCSGIMVPVSATHEHCSQCSNKRLLRTPEGAISNSSSNSTSSSTTTSSTSSSGNKNNSKSKSKQSKSNSNNTNQKNQNKKNKKNKKKSGGGGSRSSSDSSVFFSLWDDIVSTPRLLKLDPETQRKKVLALLVIIGILFLMCIMFMFILWTRLFRAAPGSDFKTVSEAFGRAGTPMRH